MIFELKVALRFLKDGKLQTMFIILGISLGVAVQIFLGALIMSLQENLFYQIIGNTSHITVQPLEDDITRLLAEDQTYIRGNRAVKQTLLADGQKIVEILKTENDLQAVSPILNTNAFLFRGGVDFPVILKGINLEEADEIYDIRSRIVAGKGQLGEGVLLGKDLAAELEVKEGESVGLLLSSGAKTDFLVEGVFDLENEAINKNWIFIDLEDLQRVLNRRGYLSSIETQIEDPFQSVQITQDLKKMLPGVEIEDWQSSNQQILTALRSQSSSSFIIQFFVIVAVTFGIASVLAVSVVQKSKEIGILKAMGCNNGKVSRIFVYEGFILGLTGAILGTGLGILLAKIFSYINIQNFVIEISLAQIVLVILIAVAAGVISSLIPARASAKLEPMEAIDNG